MPTIATQTENILDMKSILDHFTREQIEAYLAETYPDVCTDSPNAPPLVCPSKPTKPKRKKSPSTVHPPVPLKDCLRHVSKGLIEKQVNQLQTQVKIDYEPSQSSAYVRSDANVHIPEVGTSNVTVESCWEHVSIPDEVHAALADVVDDVVRLTKKRPITDTEPTEAEVKRVRDQVRAEAKANGKKQEAAKIAQAAAKAATAAASYKPPPMPMPMPVHVELTPEQEVTRLYGRIEDVKRELARVQILADDATTNKYIIKKVFERVHPNLKREWKSRFQNLVSDIRKYHASQLTLQNHAPCYNLPTRWVERLEQNVAALHKESLRQKQLFIGDQKMLADMEAKAQAEAAKVKVQQVVVQAPTPKSPPPASDAQTTIMIQLANQTFENPLQPPAHIVGCRIPDVCKVFEHGVKQQDGTEFVKGISKKRLTELQSMATAKKNKVERVHYYVHPRCKQTSIGVQIVGEAGSYAFGRRLFVAWFPCEVNADRTRIKLHIRDVCVPPTKYTGKDVRIDLSRKDKRQRVFELLQAMEGHVHCPIVE